jgi:hypothetical protein
VVLEFQGFHHSFHKGSHHYEIKQGWKDGYFQGKISETLSLGLHLTSQAYQKLVPLK